MTRNNTSIIKSAIYIR